MWMKKSKVKKRDSRSWVSSPEGSRPTGLAWSLGDNSQPSCAAPKSRSAPQEPGSQWAVRKDAVRYAAIQRKAAVRNDTEQWNLVRDALIQRKEENRTGMPDRLKAGLEGLSGFDLSGVRVHYNSPEPAKVQALAYTQGQDIHVASGQERFLPHEGWHVVQQMQGRVRPTLRMKGVGVNDELKLEREADEMGGRAESSGQYYNYNSATEKVALYTPLKTGQNPANLSGVQPAQLAGWGDYLQDTVNLATHIAIFSSTVAAAVSAAGLGHFIPAIVALTLTFVRRLLKEWPQKQDARSKTRLVVDWLLDLTVALTPAIVGLIAFSTGIASLQAITAIVVAIALCAVEVLRVKDLDRDSIYNLVWNKAKACLDRPSADQNTASQANASTNLLA